MKFKSLLLVLLFTLMSVSWAQQAPSQVPASPSGPGGRSQMRAEQRQNMMGCTSNRWRP